MEENYLYDEGAPVLNYAPDPTRKTVTGNDGGRFIGIATSVEKEDDGSVVSVVMKPQFGTYETPGHKTPSSINIAQLEELLAQREKNKRVPDEVVMNPQSERALMKVYSVLCTVPEFAEIDPTKLERIAQTIVEKLCQL